MARVTVEDCLERVSNRFALTVLAARRARALSEGRGTPLVECDNKEEVTALREVGKNKVRWIEDVEDTMRGFIEEQRSQLQSTTGEHTFLEAASLTGGEGEEGDEEDVVQELPSDLEKLGTGSPEGEDDDADGDTPEGTVAEEESPDADGIPDDALADVDDDDADAGDGDDEE